MATTEEITASKMDTHDHREKVGSLLATIANLLIDRSQSHDKSKLEDPELSAYAETIPQLKGLEYGTEEHRAVLRQMKPAIDHHYKHNRHHPEHFGDRVEGISYMNLVDIVEMVCDWKAASARNPDANFMDSVIHNIEKFGLDPQLAEIIKNTVGILDDVDLS